MNRAAIGAAWLRDRAQASSFLAGIGDTCTAFPIDLHAYCVLPRHYHLLVRAELAPLQAALAHLEAATGFPSGRPRRSRRLGAT
jgi:hypothetical protein